MRASRRERPSRARLLGALAAAGVALAGCGGGHRPPPAIPNGRHVAAATMQQLLARVLPGTRIATAVNLREARRELHLPADQPLAPRALTESTTDPPRSAPTAHRRAAIAALTQLASLAMPLYDDSPLFSALELGRVTGAVQFGGVEHSGLLIATSEPPAQIERSLLNAGWSKVDGGFRYPHAVAPGGRVLAHSKVALFPGGLVLAYQPEDADDAAEQSTAARSDAQLLALLARSSAPARFATVDSACLREELAAERLAPRIAIVSVRPKQTPNLGRVILASGDPDLAGLGLAVSPPILQDGRVVITVRYLRSSRAPAGTVVELARDAPVYRCS